MKRISKLIFIFVTFPFFTASADDLPDLGSSSAAIISPAKEKALGAEFMLRIRSRVAILDDPLVNDYISDLGYKLVASADAQQTEFHFFVIDDLDVNALSGPAGYVGVNSGTFDLTASESELASVMAHEIGHVTQHHIARAIARQQEMAVPNMAAMLAALALGIVAPDAAIGAMGAVAATNMNTSLTFSRSNEREADRVGMQILSRSGFDPYAMPAFLIRMQKYSMDYGDRIPTYLRTHPQTAERIADTENRAKQYPRNGNYKSSLMFYLMKARVNVITAPNSGEAVNYFRRKLQDPTAKNLPANQYGYALALDRSNRLAEAEKIMEDLATKYPDQPVYQMGLAEVDDDASNPQQALKELNKIIGLYPDYYPLVIQYASTLIDAKQEQRAIDFIKQEQLQQPNDPVLYKLLSKAEGQIGNLGSAYQARARYFKLLGDRQMAVVQLQQALEVPNLSADDRAAINAELNSLRPNNRM